MQKILAGVVILGYLLCTPITAVAEEFHGMVRIAVLEIKPGYMAEYLAILEEETEASVRLEPGVIAIFPMRETGTETTVKILEIYASQQAYEAHLETPHFLKYKRATLHMVSNLTLIDMQAVDPNTMAQLFKKMP